MSTSTTGCRGHAPAPSLAAPAAGQPLGSVALATVSIALAPVGFGEYMEMCVSVKERVCEREFLSVH